MKSLAYSLKRSYFIIIFLFVVLFVTSLIITGEYIIGENRLDMRNAMSFLDYEIGDEKGNRIDEIFSGNLVKSDFKKENASLKNLELIISYKNKEYAEREDKKFKEVYPDNQVKDLDFYEYLVLSKNIKAKEGEILKVTLVKSLKKEKRLFIKVVEIFIIGLIITITISIIGIKYFLKKINSQLDVLQGFNERIDLNNLKLVKPKNKFLEFEKICNSYERMIDRLDEQSQKQIEFVHSASHELKTPIFIIKGYMDMIKRWGSKDEAILKESIDAVEDEVNSMVDLVEKLLFIAKDREIRIEKTEIEISEIIIEVIQNLKRVYLERKVEFKPEYMIFQSDEGLLKILLKNILDNALKYGKGKPVFISCSENKDEIKIEIEDQGEGIDEKEIPHIFDRFYRVDRSRDKSIKGHGLGMTIVKRVTDILDIDIKVESKKSMGTKVILLMKKV